MSWATKGGGAGAEELGRRLTETLGELRAHFNGYLRRAVDGLKASATGSGRCTKSGISSSKTRRVIVLPYLHKILTSGGCGWGGGSISNAGR